MTKNEFIAGLNSRLAALPESERQSLAEYYSEMIDDRVEDGMTEEDAVAAMGGIDAIAAEKLAERPLPQLIRERVRPRHALRAWEIVLLVLGSPVWLPLLIAAAVVFLAVYVVIWAVVASVYAIDLSLAAAGIGGVAGAFVFGAQAHFAQGAFVFGAGLALAGMAVLLFFGANLIAKGAITAGRWILRRTKALFIKKEAAE